MMWASKSFHFVFVLLIAVQYSYSFGQTACSGSLSGNFDSISVSSGSCTLNGVTVTGSIEVSSGASLFINGRSQISGSVSSEGGGNINIGGQTQVSGDVSIIDSPSATVTIGQGAVLTSVNMEKSGRLAVQGSVGSVGTKESGQVFINGGSITSGGLLVEIGSGDVSLCGASITGSLSVTETTGNIRTVPNCPTSTIVGSVGVEKGTGNLNLNGADISEGDVSVVEQNGDVVLSSAAISDLSIEKSMGNINLVSLTTDSDVKIIENSGTVIIRGSTFGGDVAIGQNGAVSVTASRFSDESVSISETTGMVNFSGNSQASASISEGGSATISSNDLTSLSVEKNSGPVTISNNRIGSLTCVDNTPAPVGFGNMIAMVAAEQCAGF